MDTIYSQRTGQSPVSFAQPAPYNPMASQPARNRVNMAQLADYMKASRGMTPDAYAATQPGVQQGGMDLASLANQAQQDNQNITRPDYDINPQQPQQPMAPQGIDVNSLLSQITGAGSLAGIQAGAPQDQPNGAQPGPEVFQNEQTMGQAGLLPTSAPKEISQNPTNDVKQYSQNAVQAGLNGVDLGFQARTPTNGMSAESQNLDAQRIKGDMTSIAQAKDPKAAWQEVKKDPFYKDSNFYTGMMNVGLAIMSGANPMQAFQAGSQAMTNADMKEQLKGNREYLMQMYTPDSIAAATASGDPTLLKQKRMSDEDRLAAENNIWQARNDVTSQQEQARAERDNKWAIDRQQRQIDSQEASSDRILKRQLAVLDYKDKKKAEDDSNDIYGGLSARQVSPITAQFRTAINQNATKMMAFNKGERLIQQAQDALDSGDHSKAAAAYREAQDELARGTLGSQGMLDHERRDALTESPAFVTRKANQASLQAGFGPTRAGLDFMKDQIKLAQGAEHDELNKRMDISVQRLIEAGMPEDKARRLITSSVSLGFGTGSGPNTPKKQGALSGGDDSWMLNIKK